MTPIDRRRCLQSLGLGALGMSASGWLPALANQLATDPSRRRHCILLWMAGGPSQTDTFDMKPNHENGGEFKEIATNVPGLRFSEHLPQLAQQADQLAVIRGLSTKEGDHGRGTYLMRTGRVPLGMDKYPALGAALAKQLSSAELNLPPYVSVSPFRAFNNEAFGSGFLGPQFSPLIVGENGAAAQAAADEYAKLNVDSLKPPESVSDFQMQHRLEIWKSLESEFMRTHNVAATRAHQTIYENSLRMISSDSSSAFDLSEEPEKVRDAYGKGTFGQGCLLARRLVERGVPFVEVALGPSQNGGVGWDTHANNFEAVKSLSAELDSGWANLIKDLRERGLLESTTICWMGEFGRTPTINGAAGRDHFPQAWSCVLGGGGIAGGQAYGRTSEDGMHVEEGRCEVTDVLATLCAALGVEPETQNMSNSGRPIAIVEGAPISQLLA